MFDDDRFKLRVEMGLMLWFGGGQYSRKVGLNGGTEGMLANGTVVSRGKSLSTRGSPVACPAGLVEIGIRDQDEGLNGDQDLQQGGLSRNPTRP